MDSCHRSVNGATEDDTNGGEFSAQLSGHERLQTRRRTPEILGPMSRDKRGPARFLFLEVLDPEINALLSSLRRTFDDRESSSGIHITIRGPYYEEIRGKDIKKYEQIIRRDPILIHGIDMFRNPDEIVVFIRVHSVALSEVWWKPDFPKERYGFNPHISLFKSENVELALAVLNFLKKEELKLISHNFRS